MITLCMVILATILHSIDSTQNNTLLLELFWKRDSNCHAHEINPCADYLVIGFWKTMKKFLRNRE